MTTVLHRALAWEQNRKNYDIVYAGNWVWVNFRMCQVNSKAPAVFLEVLESTGDRIVLSDKPMYSPAPGNVRVWEYPDLF